MSAALQHELRAPVLTGVGASTAEAVRELWPAVPASLLPECACILGDCERDHDNE